MGGYLKKRTIRDLLAAYPAASIGITICAILVIESLRRMGLFMPVPILLLFATVVSAGVFAGRLIGCMCGLIAGSYIMYVDIFGIYMPVSGNVIIQFFTIQILFVGTGFMLGRHHHDREKHKQGMQEQQKILEQTVKDQTARLLARIIHQTPGISFRHAGSAGLTAEF